jgi:hypothetical protein
MNWAILNSALSAFWFHRSVWRSHMDPSLSFGSTHANPHRFAADHQVGESSNARRVESLLDGDRVQCRWEELTESRTKNRQSLCPNRMRLGPCAATDDLATPHYVLRYQPTFRLER